MTRAMICGSRREEDIRLLVESGADGIGLITEVWQKIACNLSREEARKLGRLIPPLVSSVLIVTEEKLDEICRMVEHISPDVLQIHGFNKPQDTAALKQRLNIKIIKVLHLQGEQMAGGNDPLAYAGECVSTGADAILLDSWQTDKVGATGIMAPLHLARAIRDSIYPVPLILSGGLTVDNVSVTIDQVLPYSVDVHSGVITQACLDAAKVKQFIAQVHSH